MFLIFMSCYSVVVQTFWYIRYYLDIVVNSFVISKFVYYRLIFIQIQVWRNFWTTKLRFLEKSQTEMYFSSVSFYFLYFISSFCFLGQGWMEKKFFRWIFTFCKFSSTRDITFWRDFCQRQSTVSSWLRQRNFVQNIFLVLRLIVLHLYTRNTFHNNIYFVLQHKYIF